MFDAEANTGKFVKAIFVKRDEVLGKRMLGAITYQTPAEMLSDFKIALPNAGKDAKFFSLLHEMLHPH